MRGIGSEQLKFNFNVFNVFVKPGCSVVLLAVLHGGKLDVMRHASVRHRACASQERYVYKSSGRLLL